MVNTVISVVITVVYLPTWLMLWSALLSLFVFTSMDNAVVSVDIAVVLSTSMANAVLSVVIAVVVYFAKGEPRNVEYCKVFLWKYNVWVLRTRKQPDAKFFIHSILRNWPNYMLIR